MSLAARSHFALVFLAIAIAGCSEPLEKSATEGGGPSHGQVHAPAEKRAKPAPPLAAQQVFYQYIDERGAVRFAASLDEVPADKRASAGRVEMDAPRPQPAPRTRPAAGNSPKSLARNDVEVVLYTTTWCGYCKKAIAYLDRIGQDYENKDIEASEEAASEHREYSDSGGVPTIRVGDQIMQGWDERTFRELLAKAN